MSLYHSPRVVTDGLVLYLDAANKRSYPGTGTTWFDVSGNGNNATLINGPSYSSNNFGEINFDGDNDYATTNTTPIEIQGNPNLTVSGWFKRLSDEVGNTGTWGIGGNVTNQGICSWWYNNSNEITIDTWGQATFTTNTTYPLNEWVYVTWQKNAGSMTRDNCIIWKNLNSYTGSQLSILRAENVAPNLNNNGVTLAKISTSYNVPVNFSISNFKIYNRILSASEIKQNFNALKGRYGL